jgi:hypothetical protein
VLDVPDLDQALGAAVGEVRERRWLAIAEKREDQAEIFAGRIGANPHLAGEACLLGGLLHALAGAVELPAVINAADGIVLDPAQMDRRAPMRAAIVDDPRLTRCAAVERVVLAHDADRLGLTGCEILAAMDRVPELPQEDAARRAPPRCRQVDHGVRGALLARSGRLA